MNEEHSSDPTLNEAKIRIITNSDIRYEGVLYKINPNEKTITLKSVQSFGTENRKLENPMPASSLIYEYIVFRSIEIKDLLVLKDEAETGGQSSDSKPKETKEAPKPEVQSKTTGSNVTGKKSEEVPVKTNYVAKPSGQQQQEKQQEKPKIETKKPEESKNSNYGQKSNGPFQFDKMVESLSDFERKKLVISEKYESKYDNDDFFDTISSSVANEKKREIESYNDKRLDKDTFGHVPRIHFSTDYHHNKHDRNSNNSGNNHSNRVNNGNSNSNSNSNNYSNSNSNNYSNSNSGYNQQYQQKDGRSGNFKKKTNDRKGYRKEEQEYIYVKKEV